MRNSLGTAKLSALATAALILAGCGGGGSSSGGGGSTSDTNIVGQITNDAVVSSSDVTLMGKLVGMARRVLVASCTVKAYALDGTTVVAEGTSNSDGTFTLTSTSLVAGESYKVVTTCGSDKMTAIIGADDTPAADKLDEAPAVSPLTTLIVTQIIKAVTEAIDAINGLPDAAKAAIIDSLFSPDSLKGLISTVQTAITSAIDSGLMAPPSVTAATNMTSAIETVSATGDGAAAAVTTAETAYTTDPEAEEGSNNVIPPTVSSSVTGAAQAASSFPACDSSRDHVRGRRAIRRFGEQLHRRCGEDDVQRASLRRGDS